MFRFLPTIRFALAFIALRRSARPSSWTLALVPSECVSTPSPPAPSRPPISPLTHRRRSSLPRTRRLLSQAARSSLQRRSSHHVDPASTARLGGMDARRPHQIASYNRSTEAWLEAWMSTSWDRCPRSGQRGLDPTSFSRSPSTRRNS
jgi:hypothetical protein